MSHVTVRDVGSLLTQAQLGLRIEAEALLRAADRLGPSLIAAADLILAHKGKVIVTGVGKSGHIARQFAATLQSTGTPAVFLHAAEAAHGDLGVCQPGDPVIFISNSGATAQLLALAQPLRTLGCSLIGILGNMASPLASELTVGLDASVQREADPDGFTPTASAIVALAVTHALAIVLMRARGFGKEEFRHLHGGGQLGRNLSLTVREVMHGDDEVAWVTPETPLRQVVIAMSSRPLGAACVGREDHALAGLVTDGDLRRALEQHEDIRPLQASHVMTSTPVTIGPDALLHDALCLMEDRPRQISVLPVVNPAGGKCLGLLRLHDIYRGDTE
jgi:arabinose-5-phosphate isomerase